MLILVMDATGARKTTVGKLLAQRLGWRFLDSDDFHPAANIEMMKHGISLTHEDREPWLAAIHAALMNCAMKNQSTVLACSALKQRRRGKLALGLDLSICYLTVPSMKSSRASRTATGTLRAKQSWPDSLRTSRSRVIPLYFESATHPKTTFAKHCGR